jgi:hypothetical protein
MRERNGTISPLRQRMLEAMRLRKLSPNTRAISARRSALPAVLHIAASKPQRPAKSLFSRGRVGLIALIGCPKHTRVYCDAS